ncbi:MAG: GGDEF domain-containing protein [Pseudomonadota bacterium]
MLQKKEAVAPSENGESSAKKEYEYVSSLAQKVLTLAEEHTNPPYPKSYEVLYTYFSGHNSNLRKLADEIIAEKGSLTREDLERIYSETLDSPGKFHDVQLDTGKKLNSELDEISTLVEKYMTANTEYSSCLNESVRDLSSVESAGDLKGMIANLIRENENMRDQTLELSKSLENSKGQIYDLKMCLTAAIEDSMKDPLTDIGNRRWLERSLSKVLETSDFNIEKYCLVLIDLDHFKKINDTFGHLVGDKVLRYFGSILNKSIKGQNICARYGGEEFAILLSGYELDKAVGFMNEIRKKLEGSNLVLSNTKKSIGTVTASFGVTTVKNGDTMEELLDRADELLYSAKSAGRNQVVSG